MEQRGDARPGTCKGCGAQILLVPVDMQSWPVALDEDNLPITVEVTTVAPWRLWHHLGPRLGWSPAGVAARTWRPLRTLHECASNSDTLEKETKSA